MLYRPEAFEPLTDEPWNDERARAGIREIVEDTDAALRGPKLLWRADDWDRWQATSPMKNLYAGAAGVLWALDELRRSGHAETELDLADLALRNLELFRNRPDFMKIDVAELRESSLVFGETGILLVAYRLAPSRELADALLERVRANTSNDADEVMWGTPGTMIAARTMLEWTDDERWRRSWEESADALWSRRTDDRVWVQRLHGRTFTYLGPAHGLVGNVQALTAAARRRPPHCSRTGYGGDPRAGRACRCRTCELAARGTAGTVRAGRSDPCPVVPRRTRNHLVRGHVSGRGADARRRRADVAGRAAAWAREGARNLSRHCGQRLRVPEGIHAHRRRALARPRAPLRRARTRAGATAPCRAWPRPLLALDGDLGVALYVAECLDAGSVYPFFDLRD